MQRAGEIERRAPGSAPRPPLRPDQSSEPRVRALQIQRALGNRTLTSLLTRDPSKGSAGMRRVQREARTKDEREGLIEDAFQAVVQNETGGTPVESRLHTAAGTPASFKNATQMIAVRVIGELLTLSESDRASITTLTKKELVTANAVAAAAGKVWDHVVSRKDVDDPDDARKKLGTTLTQSRLGSDEDLDRLFEMRGFVSDVKAAANKKDKKGKQIEQGTLGKREEDLSKLTDVELLGRANAKERPKLKAGASMTAKQRSALVKRVAHREVFGEIAAGDHAQALGMTANDAETYFHGGALDIFGEDRGAWQRRALTRPPSPEAPSDELESRLRDAAESGGGFRLSRLTFHSHLSRYLDAHPDATDEEVASEAAFYNFGSSKSSSAKTYAARIRGFFKPIRGRRAQGAPLIRGVDDDGPVTGSSVVTIPEVTIVGDPALARKTLSRAPLRLLQRKETGEAVDPSELVGASAAVVFWVNYDNKNANNAEFENAARDFAKTYHTLGLDEQGGTRLRRSVPIAVRGRAELVVAIQKIGGLLAELPGDEKPKIGTVAIFAHGENYGLGIDHANANYMTAKHLPDFVAAVSPALSGDVKFLLYACSSGAAKGEKISQTSPDEGVGGAGSFAQLLADTLGGSASVYAHEVAGNVASNPFARRFTAGSSVGQSMFGLLYGEEFVAEERDRLRRDKTELVSKYDDDQLTAKLKAAMWAHYRFAVSTDFVSARKSRHFHEGGYTGIGGAMFMDEGSTREILQKDFQEFWLDDATLANGLKRPKAKGKPAKSKQAAAHQ